LSQNNSQNDEPLVKKHRWGTDLPAIR